jgi:hypothetical protein
MTIVVVDVALKPEILDPQGRAILGALGRVGLVGVADVRQGKQFVLSIDELRSNNFCGIFVAGTGYSDENLQVVKFELSKDFGDAILISESQKSYLFRIPGEK